MRRFCGGLYPGHRDTVASEEELDTRWSPARVRPSVALQMKTLNNLVAGCKSRREATLIDTYRCVPRRYVRSTGGTFMNARYESRDNNIVRVLLDAHPPQLPVRNEYFPKSPSKRASFDCSQFAKSERETREDAKPIRLTKSGRLSVDREINRERWSVTIRIGAIPNAMFREPSPSFTREIHNAFII